MTGNAASVVGAGVVTPAGSTIDDLWECMVAGQHTLAEQVVHPGMPGHPALVCRPAGFDPSQRLGRHEIRRLDRSHQMAMWAADDALADAGPGPELDRCAVVVGLGFGAAEYYEHQYNAFVNDGFRAISPLAIPVIMTNSIAAHLSIRYGFTGPSLTVSAACASGAVAIGEALWMLRSGRVDRVLAGGVDALNTPHVLGPFLRMEAMSTRFDDPERSSRPFAAGRDGFVLGEGAGFVVLERATQGAPSRGRILGYAANSDAHHIVAPPDGGSGAAACMRAALVDAGIEPGDVGHVNAHGTSTPRNDSAEAAAISAVFGHGIPVTANKAVFGHLIGAAGAVEAIIALESIRRGMVPGTANHAGDHDAEIDALVTVVDTATASTVPIAVSNSFGFGGHNASLVIGS